MLTTTFIVFTDNDQTKAMGATMILLPCLLLLSACFAQGTGIYKAGIHIETTRLVIMTSPKKILNII